MSNGAKTDASDPGADRIRETTKWIIACFSAVGAAMVAGTQLSGIGELDPWGARMWLAILGSALALSGIAVAIWRGSTVLVSGAVALNELQHAKAYPSVTVVLRENPVLYGGYNSVHAMNHAFELATREMNVAFSRLYDAQARDPELEQAAKRANDHANLVSQVVSRLLAAASNIIVRTTFKSARPWLFVGALTTALGVGIFSWAVNPPKTSKNAPPTVHLIPMRLADVVLSEEGARILGPQLGAKCDTRRVRTLVPKQVGRGPLQMVSVATEDCEPVQFVLSQTMGSVLENP